MKFVSLAIWLFLAALSKASYAQIPMDLQNRLFEARQNDNCLKGAKLARQILNYDPDHLESLKTIVDCTHHDVSASYANMAREMFEESHILSIVPQLLEMANIKDLVPIIREVETKEGKSVADYLMLTELYEKLGEPEKQIRALENAIAMDPNDPRPKLILASKKYDAGDRKGAQKLFKEYLFNAPPHPGKFYLITYVAAMTYPVSVVTLLLIVIWVLGLILKQRWKAQFDYIEGQFSGKLRDSLPFIVALVPIVMAGQFWTTGSALPFGILMSVLVLEVIAFSWPVLGRKILRPVFRWLRKGIGTLTHGVKFARFMTNIPTGWRLFIAVGALFIMGTVVPNISIPDIRYALTIVCSLLFYGTVGSLLVTVLRSSSSLQNSMRLIGVAATIPFIMSYVISHWQEIGTPLAFGRLPTPTAINGLVNYLIFWGVSVMLAMHLSKILADALIEPVREIMGNVKKIKTGNFDVEVKVKSNDEVGKLADAVNDMASGLKQREFIKKTFSRYVDEKVVEKLLDGEEEKEVEVGGQKMEATVMFVDIRGFTAMSENLEPETIVTMLNMYFSEMVEIVRGHGGVIDKYMGDNMMCVWGVPNKDTDGVMQAVRTALDMQKQIVHFNEKLKQERYPDLNIGIGINTGDVVAGSIGCSERMEYTVIGDVVNSAQRAESRAKSGEILITQAVYEKAREFIVCEEREKVEVKGKAQMQTFYNVTDVVEAEEYPDVA